MEFVKMQNVISVGALAAVLCGALAAAAEPVDDLAARELLDRWVEAKETLSRERQAWRLGEQMLRDRIDLVSRETAALRERTKTARDDIGEADEKLEEQKARNDALKAATAGLDEDIARLEARVHAMLKRAPSPFVERVLPLSKRIPLDPSDTELSLSERFATVIGILNEMNKFSREIVEASEVRDLPDGTKSSVTVLYLGLAQAYYCNPKSGVAGIGRPGDEGWVWEARDDLAEEIADVQAIFRNEKPAVYVGLPVELL
jgi:hypothetical protein